MSRIASEIVSLLGELEPAAATSDAELLSRFQGGEHQAFELLLRRHGPMVMGVCRRVLGQTADADDAFQATFLVLVRCSRTVRRQASLSCWLHGVAWRTAQAARRRRHRRRHEPLASAAELAATPATEPWLDDELRQLPDWLRQPLVLGYLEGLNKAQIAQRLKLPEGTVSSRLSRAREQLRRRLIRRGLAPAIVAGLMEASPARAAVPAALAAATWRAASHVASGGALSSCGVSASVIHLAQGALIPMTLARWSVVAVLVVFVGAGSGAGVLLHHGHLEAASFAASPQEPPKATPPTATGTAPVVGSGNTGDKRSVVDLRRRLVDPVKPLAQTGEESTLDDVLELLRKKFEVKIDVDESTFQPVAGEEWPGDARVTVPRLSTPTLDGYLRRVLRTGNATYLQRGDCLVVVHQDYVSNGLHLKARVQFDVREPMGLKQALEHLAEQHGVTIVLDSRVADKAADARVQGLFQNVSLETAVLLLAEMANLRVVALEGAFFVTSEEYAKRVPRLIHPEAPQ